MTSQRKAKTFALDWGVAPAAHNGPRPFTTPQARASTGTRRPNRGLRCTARHNGWVRQLGYPHNPQFPQARLLRPFINKGRKEDIPSSSESGGPIPLTPLRTGQDSCRRAVRIVVAGHTRLQRMRRAGSIFSGRRTRKKAGPCRGVALPLIRGSFASCRYRQGPELCKTSPYSRIRIGWDVLCEVLGLVYHLR
jgi:hypothetical protein